MSFIVSTKQLMKFEEYMAADRKEYYRIQKAKKRAESKNVDNYSVIVDTNPLSTFNQLSTNVHTFDIDEKMFEGKGRGVPANGYVLIDKVGVIKGSTWIERLNKVCAHGLTGWSCKAC